MQRLTAWTMIAVGAFMASGCKKGKNSQATVEEVPAATANVADSATALTEEPSLANVQGKLQGSAPSTFHPSSAEGLSPKGRFVIQVGVFKSRNQANQAKQKLIDAGYPAYVADVESPTPELSGTYHRVRIGNFETPKAAHAFGSSLSGAYWVDKKSRDHVGGGEDYSSPSPAPAEPSYSAPSTPAPTYESSSPTPPASAPSPPISEPVGVPEPPAPSEPTPAADNSWGNPISDAPGSSTGTAVPAAPKDTTGGAVEGW